MQKLDLVNSMPVVFSLPLCLQLQRKTYIFGTSIYCIPLEKRTIFKRWGGCRGFSGSAEFH